MTTDGGECGGDIVSRRRFAARRAAQPIERHHFGDCTARRGVDARCVTCSLRGCVCGVQTKGALVHTELSSDRSTHGGEHSGIIAATLAQVDGRRRREEFERVVPVHAHACTREPTHLCADP